MTTELVGAMRHRRAPVALGIVAGASMLGFYFGVHSLTDSFAHALYLLGEVWPWIAALVVGFSIVVGLFVYVIQELKARRGAATPC